MRDAAEFAPLGGTVEQFAQTIKDDRAFWGPIIAKENIKIDQN